MRPGHDRPKLTQTAMLTADDLSAPSPVTPQENPATTDSADADAQQEVEPAAPVEPSSAAMPESPKLNPLREYEIKHAAMLQEKQRKSEEAQAALLERAAGELTQFYQERTQTIEKRKVQNREAESATKQHLASTEGNVWARAVDVIDMQQTFTKDVSRLKNTMLRLKNQPPRPAAAVSSPSS